MAEAVAHTAEHEHSHPNYMAVFWWLFAITVAEVGVAYIPMSVGLLIVILLLMAFGKAILVALYFMHLKYDNKLLMIIAAVPVILAAIAVTIVAAEYSSYTITDTARTKPPASIVGHE